MTTINIIILVVSLLLTYPLSHIFMKKGMTLDRNFTDEKYRDIAKFFYIPCLNVVVSFFYLVWMVVIFKE